MADSVIASSNRKKYAGPDPDKAVQQLEALATTTINLDEITQALEKAGVKSFAEAFDRLMTAISDKRQQILSS